MTDTCRKLAGEAPSSTGKGRLEEEEGARWGVAEHGKRWRFRRFSTGSIERELYSPFQSEETETERRKDCKTRTDYDSEALGALFEALSYCRSTYRILKCSFPSQLNLISMNLRIIAYCLERRGKKV